MNVKDAEDLLKLVEQSLRSVPRNEYEAENRLRDNVERLRNARSMLSQFSGAYIEHPLILADRLERQLNEATFRPTAASAVTDAFALDVDEAVDDEELAQAEAELAKGEKKKSGKSKASAGTKSKGTKGKDKGGKTKSAPAESQSEAKRAANRTSPSPNTNVEEAPREIVNASPTQTPSPRTVLGGVELARYDGCRSDAIPAAAFGPGRCAAIPSTPLAAVDFANEMDFDGQSCRCRLEVYRSVLMALHYGQPTAALPTTTAVAATTTAPPTQPPSAGSGAAPVSSNEASAGVLPVSASDAAATAESVTEDTEETEDSVPTEEENLATLSEKLVAEYNAAQEELEEADHAGSLPQELTQRLTSQLRELSFVTYAVFLCHGGYFAGGVFVNGSCVVHKSFQRYVVRKKQGGKQSSNAKDAGSYNSIGSQIRAAQEGKWKIDVRDILLAWSGYLNAAAVILYAAPGPQNRAVLTDFSALPPVNGQRVVSPISTKDARVHKIPLTTHRPNFEEVQRVYETVSKCNVLYVKETTAA